MSDDAKADTAAEAGTEGLVTLCAWSNTVMHDGEWMPFATYLERRFGVLTTHGISPKGMEKFERDEEAPAGGALKDPLRLAAVRATGFLDTPPTAASTASRDGGRLR